MSDSDPESQKRDGTPSEKERTKTLVRRAGYVVFLGGGFVFFVVLMVGVVQGISQDRAWDPYTGHPHRGGPCIDRTRSLVQDAAERDSLTTSWEGRYRNWVIRCKSGYPELYELLKHTRLELQDGEDTEESND